MEYRINKEWTSHAVITAVAVNIVMVLMGRAKAEAAEFIGDAEARTARRKTRHQKMTRGENERPIKAAWTKKFQRQEQEARKTQEAKR